MYANTSSLESHTKYEAVELQQIFDVFAGWFVAYRNLQLIIAYTHLY